MKSVPATVAMLKGSGLGRDSEFNPIHSMKENAVRHEVKGSLIATRKSDSRSAMW